MHCWWECKTVQPLWRIVKQVLKKLNVKLAYNPVILLLGIYPKELKTRTQTPRVYFSLMQSSQKVETTQMSSRWMNKQIWSVHSVEYYSATRKNKFSYMLQHGWSLSEVSLIQKNKYWSPLIQNTRIGKFMETK